MTSLVHLLDGACYQPDAAADNGRCKATLQQQYKGIVSRKPDSVSRVHTLRFLPHLTARPAHMAWGATLQQDLSFSR